MNTETTPAPKEVPQPAEHAEFEAWCRSEGMTPDLWMPGQPQCGYSNPRIMDYWRGWHARAALAASGAPQEAPGDASSDKLDAARYRWLRAARSYTDVSFETGVTVRIGSPEQLDAAIDAAMKGPQ